MRSQMFEQLPAKGIFAKTGKDRGICAAFDKLARLIAGLAAGRSSEAHSDHGFTPPRQPLRSSDEVHVDAAENNGTWRAIITH